MDLAAREPGIDRERRNGPRVASRAALVALLSGVALAFAFPEPDIAPLAWLSIAPLLYVANGMSARAGLAIGFLFGVGFFGTLLAWISLVGFLAWGLLVAVQAAWIGAFGSAWTVLSRRCGPVARVLLAASLWVLVEYLRAHWPLGGFTWGQLAQSQHGVATVLRAASAGGGWLVAWLVVAVNACLLEAARRPGRMRYTVGWAVAIGALLIAPGALPGARLGDDRIRVAIVQGNVPRRFPGTPFEKQEKILRNHVRLTRELSEDVDLVVWPESAIGIDLRKAEGASELVESAARSAGAPMIVGGNLDVDDERYQVMAFQFSEAGRLVDYYQKTHLVPFGEYVPARSWLDWIPVLDQIPRDAVAGDQPVVFEVAGTRAAPVISFEADFGSLVRRRLQLEGRLLVVCTNTSTWGEAWASAQHLAFSRVRAVENGVPVVHAALSGISAFVDAGGSVERRTDLWTATTIVHDVRLPDGVAFYTRAGDWVPLGACLHILGAVVAHFRRRPAADSLVA